MKFYKNILFFLPICIYAQDNNSVFVLAPDTGIKNIFQQETVSRSFRQQLAYFERGQYLFFLNELQLWKTRNPYRYTNEISWLEGHALLQVDRIQEAKNILLSLTNSSNIEIQQRALYDLAGMHFRENKIPEALKYLQTIQNAPPSSVHEAALVQMITILLQQKNYSKAQTEIIHFSNLYPSSAYINELYYLLAFRHLLDGNVKKAEEYSLAITRTKENILVQRLLAEIALQKKDYLKAIQYFQLLTTNNNRFQDEARYKLALIYKLQKDYHSAEQNLKILINYFPYSGYQERAKAELASVYTLLRKYNEALNYYRYESAYKGERKAKALLKITELYFLKGDTPAALRAARRVQKEFPYSSYANEALYWIGRAYMQDKRFQKSIDVFNSYLIREPVSPQKDEISIFLGHAYANINNKTEARRHFQNIVRDSTNNLLKQNALLGLGRSYSVDNQPGRALEYFDLIWKTWPDAEIGDQALYLSGVVRYNLRQNKEAVNNLSRLTNRYPDSAFRNEALLVLAKLQFKAENFDQVKDIANLTSVQDKEMLSEIKELLARSEFRLGNFESALTNFQDAAKLTRNSQRLTELLLAEASTFRNLGRHKAAVKLYEKYLNSLDEKKEISQLQDLFWSEIILSYIEAKEYNKAQEALNYFSANFPSSKYLGEIYFKLADERFTQRDYKKAAFLYRSVREKGNDKNLHSEALLREAWSLSFPDELSAESLFREFLAAYPNHAAVPEVLIKMAELQDIKGNNLAAQKFREELVDRFSSSLEAEKARIFLAARFDRNDSEEIYRKAIAQYSDKKLKAKILQRLADKLESEKQDLKMLSILMEIHELRDADLGADAALKAAKLYLIMGDGKKSLPIFVSIVTDYDQKYIPDALLGIIESYLLMNDFASAQKIAIRIFEQYPNSRQARRASVLLAQAGA